MPHTNASLRLLYLYRQSWRGLLLRQWLGRRMHVHSMDFRAAVYGQLPELHTFDGLLVDCSPELGIVIQKVRPQLTDQTVLIALADDSAAQAAGAYAVGVDAVETFPPGASVIEGLLHARDMLAPPGGGSGLPEYWLSSADVKGDGAGEPFPDGSLPVEVSGLSNLPEVPTRRLAVDPDRHVCWVNGKRVHLPATPFRLLVYLLESDGACCTRQELLDAIWGHDYVSGSDVVANTVKRVRATIRTIEPHVRLETVRGVGYRLTIED